MRNQTPLHHKRVVRGDWEIYIVCILNSNNIGIKSNVVKNITQNDLISPMLYDATVFYILLPPRLMLHM